MVGSIVLMFAGLGAFCVLLYACAVYALPVAVGLWAGYWAMQTGAGLGSVAIGLAAGAMVFVLGQVILATSRSLLIRWIILLAFTVPAIVAGYSMMLQFSEFGVPSAVWRHVFAAIGAAAIGCTAIARLAAPTPQSGHKPQSLTPRPGLPQPTGLQKTMLLP